MKRIFVLFLSACANLIQGGTIQPTAFSSKQFQADTTWLIAEIENTHDRATVSNSNDAHQ